MLKLVEVLASALLLEVVDAKLRQSVDVEGEVVDADERTTNVTSAQVQMQECRVDGPFQLCDTICQRFDASVVDRVLGEAEGVD